ncbi:MAG: YopX family protein [Treponema sp.]|jgi:uncharacterized phage protein (TIGR01671 family)|nr:YopX family protein [Treponema sp.]
MREIEFRGKRRDGKWFYGSLITDRFETPDGSGNMDSGKAGLIVLIQDNKRSFTHEVIPETVGQYTGLEDRKGVKIFEGDIVRLENGVEDETIAGFVTFQDASWQVDYGPELISLWHQLVGLEEYQTAEVIGNIHDTPELLVWDHEYTL